MIHLRRLYSKELNAYFNTPSAYIIAVAFLLITGYFFTQSLFLAGLADIRPFVDLAPLLLVFFVPGVTMRLFAEEAKSGTLDLLLALPVSYGEVLMAKFLAAFSLMTATLTLTLIYPLSLAFLGKIDPGAVAGAYIGLVATGGVLVAAGLLASSLTRNQVVAFIIGFVPGFVFYLLGKVSAYIPLWLAPLVDFLGFDSHLDSLGRGVFDSRDLVYYLTITAFFLLLAHTRMKLVRAS